MQRTLQSKVANYLRNLSGNSSIFFVVESRFSGTQVLKLFWRPFVHRNKDISWKLIWHLNPHTNETITWQCHCLKASASKSKRLKDKRLEDVCRTQNPKWRQRTAMVSCATMAQSRCSTTSGETTVDQTQSKTEQQAAINTWGEMAVNISCTVTPVVCVIVR